MTDRSSTMQKRAFAVRVRHSFRLSLAIGAVTAAFGCSSGGSAGSSGMGGSGPSGAAGMGPSGAAGVAPTGVAGVGPTGAAGSTGGAGGLASRPQPQGMYTVGTPPDPGPWGATPVTTGAVPVIVYPSSETRFPRNIYRT